MTEKEKSCIAELKELHTIIASTLKEDIIKFNSLFDGDIRVIYEKKKAEKKKAEKEKAEKAKILGSIVKSKHLVG